MRSCVVALSLVACGSGASSPQPAGGEAGSAGTTTGSAGAGGAGSTASYHASLVAETTAGRGPAMTRLHNATEHIVTLQVGGASFWQIAPEDNDLVVPQLAVSGDVAGDARLGFHETKDPLAPCIFLPFTSVAGPSALEPGRAYTLRVVGDTVDTLSVEVSDEGVAEPFVAVRGWRSAAVPGATSLHLEPGSLELDLTLGSPTQYVLTGVPPLVIDTIRFDTPSGSYLGEPLLALDDAAGYTVAVGEPLPDAEAVVELRAGP